MTNVMLCFIPLRMKYVKNFNNIYINVVCIYYGISSPDPEEKLLIIWIFRWKIKFLVFSGTSRLLCLLSPFAWKHCLKNLVEFNILLQNWVSFLETIRIEQVKYRVLLLAVHIHTYVIKIHTRKICF